MPEDYITILLPLVWAGFLGLPFVGIRVAAKRQRLFEKISNYYFRFTSLFTGGSFIFLIAENQWKDALNFCLNGQLWVLHIVVPSVFWVFAGYYFYRIWRDLIRGLKEEE